MENKYTKYISRFKFFEYYDVYNFIACKILDRLYDIKRRDNFLSFSPNSIVSDFFIFIEETLGIEPDMFLLSEDILENKLYRSCLGPVRYREVSSGVTQKLKDIGTADPVKMVYFVEELEKKFPTMLSITGYNVVIGKLKEEILK